LEVSNHSSRHDCQFEAVIHWLPEILFAAQVSLRGLHRCMTEQELNLLQLAATRMTEFRAGPAQIVRCNTA
jgi:hypothetical protein